MRFSAAAFLLSSLATSVLAATHIVTVGKEGSLLYEPTSIQAAVGDTVRFQFMSKNHTVTQSTFDNPCVPKSGGADSGYQLIPAGTTVFPEWTITVTDASGPSWWMCNQAPHCARGMVFAINPTAEKTFDQFLANAKAGASAAAPAATATNSALGGGLGGGAGTPPTGVVISLTGTPTKVVPEGTAAALGSGALKDVVGWKMLFGSVLLGALVL